MFMLRIECVTLPGLYRKIRCISINIQNVKKGTLKQKLGELFPKCREYGKCLRID